MLKEIIIRFVWFCIGFVFYTILHVGTRGDD